VGRLSAEAGFLAPDAVRRMFDRIAPVYDVMNRVMTAGLDRSWRRPVLAVACPARHSQPCRVNGGAQDQSVNTRDCHTRE